MRLSPLLLLLLSLFSFSLGSPADILYIQKCLSDFALIADSGSLTGVPDFSAFEQVLARNITLDFGAQPGIVRGLANVEAVFRRNLPPGTITQNAVSTQSVALSGFDDQGSASAATALSYLTNTYFGQGNLTGQIVTLYVRLDDTLIKTKLAGNGGWRITTRITRFFVRLGVFNYFFQNPLSDAKTCQIPTQYNCKWVRFKLTTGHLKNYQGSPEGIGNPAIYPPVVV